MQSHLAALLLLRALVVDDYVGVSLLSCVRQPFACTTTVSNMFSGDTRLQLGHTQCQLKTRQKGNALITVNMSCTLSPVFADVSTKIALISSA